MWRCARLTTVVTFVIVLTTALGQDAKDEVKTKKVCDVCLCTADAVDCSNRNLTSNLDDYEWPTTSLRYISFANNSIVTVKPFPNATVAKLVFRNNGIEKIEPHAFKQLKNLTELDLSHNSLTYENLMPYAFKGPFRPEAYEPLENLSVLNLSNNQLHSMNADLFEHVPDLKVLILSNNPFKVFDTASIVAISNIPYLRELDLSGCKLKKLDENTLHSIRYLKQLNLSNNEFTDLPDALQQSGSLETLVLDGNPIVILDASNGFPELPNLKTLSLRNMPNLVAIDRGALANLPNLEVLAIENCWQLKEISNAALVKQPMEGAATWPPLKTLNISNNALRYLPATLIARWDKLEHLHLTGNQWSCDCDNQYFIGTLLPEEGPRLMGTETKGLICAAPPEHVNKSLASLANRKLRCLDLYGARPERDAAVLVGILVGLLLAIPCALIFMVFYRRGFFFCGAQGPASFSRAFYKRAAPYDNEA